MKNENYTCVVITESQKFRFLIACKLPQEYLKQPVGCQKKRLEAVSRFGVFHDFLCLAGEVADI